MLMVETHVAPSQIHGLGLFAEQNIATGTVIWRFTPLFDVTFSEVALANLPKLNRQIIKKYSYYCAKQKLYVLCCDDGRYVNHSENPNGVAVNGDYIANKHISAGEEITENYHTYSHPPYHPITTWKKFLRCIGIDRT